MSYSRENGYLPVTVDSIMNDIMIELNIQFGLSYTVDSFAGTNFYKYMYSLAQKVQSGEIKTSEVFLKLQQYIAITNERISRPVNTNPGIIEKFLTYKSTLIPNGLIASVKPMIDADAGKISICVDVNEGDRATGNVEVTSYANLVSGTADTIQIGATTFTAQAGAATPGTATFQAATSNNATATSLATQINAHATIGALVKAVASNAKVYITAKKGGTAANAYVLTYTGNGSVGMTVSGTTLTGGTANGNYEAMKDEIGAIIKQSTVGGAVTQGTEVENIALSNGQAFDFKYNLPDRIRTLLKLTITLSENNQFVVQSQDEIKTKLLQNINLRYALGKNFEPQRYYTVVDAPWAASVLLEYSTNVGASYVSTIYDSPYNELFKFDLADITIVEL